MRPIETTYPGRGRRAFGQTGGRPGRTSYKFGDRRLHRPFPGRGQYAHVGNNFVLGFTPYWRRSTGRDCFDRIEPPPGRRIRTSSTSGRRQRDVMANYFRPGLLGGDHAIRVRASEVLATTSPIGGFVSVRMATRGSGTARRQRLQLYRHGRRLDVYEPQNFSPTCRTPSRVAERRSSPASASTTTDYADAATWRPIPVLAGACGERRYRRLPCRPSASRVPTRASPSRTGRRVWASATTLKAMDARAS